MAHEQDGEQAPAPVLAQGAARGSHDLLSSVPGSDGPGGSESVTTVLVAFGANVLIARGEVGRRGADRVGVDPGRGGAFLGGHRQRDLLDDRQPPVPAAARSRAPVRPRPGGLRLVAVRRARAVRGGRGGIRRPRHPGTHQPRARRALRPRVRRAGHLLRARGRLLPAVGPAGPGRGGVAAAGPDRARPGHLRSDPAGGVRRGLRRADRPGHRGRRPGRPPADRLPGAGRGRLDPGRRAARGGRGRPDQPQPAIPGRRRRPTPACARPPSRPCWTRRRSPG